MIDSTYVDVRLDIYKSRSKVVYRDNDSMVRFIY